MTDLRTAAQMALDALESSRVFVTTREKIKYPEGTEWYDERIEALRAALAQGEQEPEPKPKCVAIVEVFGKDWRLEYMSLPVGKHKLYTQQYTYTASPKREWQGLTDEEAADCWSVSAVETWRNFEAALKEKNT